MPIHGILNTARSLSYYLRLQEVTANNVANVESDAFKADRLTARTFPGTTHPVAVEKTDLQQGVFRETTRPLDLALDGPGFFVVRTERGERLTRGGSMRLDGEGRLTDAHGDLILGTDGPIVLQGGNVEVDADGTIRVDGASSGRLRVETVEDPATLRKEGRNRFIPACALEPVTEEETHVRQGAIEEANVDPMLSMVDLITIQRAYSANIDALKAMDSVLGVVVNDVGKV